MDRYHNGRRAHHPRVAGVAGRPAGGAEGQDDRHVRHRAAAGAGLGIGRAGVDAGADRLDGRAEDDFPRHLRGGNGTLGLYVRRALPGCSGGLRRQEFFGEADEFAEVGRGGGGFGTHFVRAVAPAGEDAGDAGGVGGGHVSVMIAGHQGAGGRAAGSGEGGEQVGGVGLADGVAVTAADGCENIEQP